MEKEEIQIRKASVSDAEELLGIYAPYVEKTAISFEWDVPSVSEFRRRIENTLKKYPYLVAEKDGEILGYAYTGPFVGRAAYDWAVETSIYVARGAHRQGVGRRLYEALEQCQKKQGILNLYACIASPRQEADPHLSKDSSRFHEHMGYRLIGEFHQCGYKFDRWYDMVWMEKMVGEHKVPPEEVTCYGKVSD